MIFEYTVFILLALLLFLATGTAVYRGLFHAHRPETGGFKKFAFGLVSYLFSGLAWYGMYGAHYLGW